MKINRMELIKYVEKIMPGVENNSFIDGAENILFNNGNIYSYNDIIAVSINTKLNLNGCIKAKEFFNLIKKIPDEIIDIDCNDENWIIKTDKINAELFLINDDISKKIESITNNNEWVSIPSNFMDGLSNCLFSCNKSDLAGIYCIDKYMMSTDEITINLFNLNKNINSFWLSDDCIKKLISIFDKINFIKIDDSWAHFKNEDNLIFSCRRLMDTKYPFKKAKKILDENKKLTPIMIGEFPKKLIEVIDRASEFVTNIKGVGTVKLKLTENYIECSSYKYSGKYREKIKWNNDSHIDGSINLSVDPNTIKNAVLKTDKFYIVGEESKLLLFYNDKYTHLILTFKEDN